MPTKRRIFSDSDRLTWLIQDDSWLAHRISGPPHENGYFAGEYDHGGPDQKFGEVGPFSTPCLAIDAAIRRSRHFQEAHHGN